MIVTVLLIAIQNTQKAQFLKKNVISKYKIDFKEKNKCIILSKRKLKRVPNLKESDVKILFLNGNKIQNIENLHELIFLEELYIHNNCIRNLDTLSTQKSLINLKKLDLSNNIISNLKGIMILKNMSYINIENNLINSLKCNI